jgi:creatinine amidohydrolase
MSKPPTVFLAEMTNAEVERFLSDHHTVIVPVGSTEQHGPHLALSADVIIPQEVARRVAPKVGAVVAPPISYALSYPHVGFKGLVHIRIPTFMSLVEDLCHAFATVGFRRIVFLNGHYDNTYAIAYACANAAETAAVLAINPALVDMEKANAEFPPFPDFTVESHPVHTAFFFSAPGSVYWATKSGTWGDAREATPEMGERQRELGTT